MNSHPLSETSSIRVAEYLTELPPREVQEQKTQKRSSDCKGTARCPFGGKSREGATETYDREG